MAEEKKKKSEDVKPPENDLPPENGGEKPPEPTPKPEAKKGGDPESDAPKTAKETIENWPWLKISDQKIGESREEISVFNIDRAGVVCKVITTTGDKVERNIFHIPDVSPVLDKKTFVWKLKRSAY